MFSKIVILACALAVCNAGYLGPAAATGQYTLTTAALTSTSDNILRSSGNLAQIATQSKTISTPFSSSSKSDIRVTNPAIYAQAAPLTYAAPLAAPFAAAHPGPLLGVAYSPAVAVSHMAYSSPIGVSYSCYKCNHWHRHAFTNDRNYEPDKSGKGVEDAKDAKETTNTFLPNINGG